VLAALAALAAVGIAGAARSSTGLAACLDLARLPFPRFRILPCPETAAPGSRKLGSFLGGAAPTPGSPSLGGVESGGISNRANGRLPVAGVVPRVAGVLGNAVQSTGPWRYLNSLVLAVLLGANLLLVAVRSRIARLQSW